VTERLPQWMLGGLLAGLVLGTAAHALSGDSPTLEWGVDPFLDICRTAINVVGDLAAAAVVSYGV